MRAGSVEGQKKVPFGLMCEAPHTYLTEQVPTVGICGKGQQRDRNKKDRRGDF